MAIILLAIGPLTGLTIWSIESVIAAASIATSDGVVASGQQANLSSNGERALYVSKIAAANNCTVTGPDGREAHTSSGGETSVSSSDGNFSPVLAFKVDRLGDHRISCENLDSTDVTLMGPTFTFSRFAVPLIANLAAGIVCWIFAIILLV